MRKWFVVLAFVLAPSTWANNTHPNMDAQAILKQQQEIRAELDKPAGRFKHLSSDKRDSVFASQGTVASLLDGKQSISDLKEADRIVVFNALENIEGILNQAEDDRMICERTKPVGSNRPKTVCMTVAERRAMREQSEREITHRNQTCKDCPK